MTGFVWLLFGAVLGYAVRWIQGREKIKDADKEIRRLRAENVDLHSERKRTLDALKNTNESNG